MAEYIEWTSNLRKDCPMRHENGNCLPSGGFCTAVNAPICEAMHNAYYSGKSDALYKKEDMLQFLAMERQQYYDELQKAKAMAGELRHLYEQVKAEAAEVKHGEWVVEAYDDDNRMMIIPYIEHQHSDPFCSNCGKGALLNGAEDYVTSNYCPNCGAKMDLKEGAESDL